MHRNQGHYNMAIVQEIIDLKQFEGKFLPGQEAWIAEVPAGGKVDIKGDNLIITYEDGETPCTISVGSEKDRDVYLTDKDIRVYDFIALKPKY